MAFRTFASFRSSCYVVTVCVAIAVCAGSARAQTSPPRLDDRCIVSVLNRNVRVKPDGSWVLPNIPANFGSVRARATCIFNGVTVSGESAPFVISPNGSIDVPPIVLGPTTPIPQTVTVTGPTTPLGQIGATAQLQVTARYADNSTRTISTAATGTGYVISNPAIATITADGLVMALASGTVLIQATNEGTSGFTSVRIVLSADSDGDGLPDDLELSLGLNPNNAADAFEDADQDGLSNRDEARFGTNIRNRDTDGDGILDGEEVNLGADGFITSPLLVDTDGDGVRDSLEIQTGSDPTNPASTNLPGALERISVTPTGFTIIVNSVQGVAYTQLSVIGHLRDGTTIDLTSTQRGTNYASSDLNVCNFGQPAGRVFGGQPGVCTIGVSNNGFMASVQGTVQSFAPTSLSSVAIPGYANNVDVNGNFAYIAAGSAGLQIVNVSNPGSPVVVGSLDTPGNANDVRVVGNVAYVADGFGGLRMIDVSNPSAPVFLGAFDTPGEANDVVVVNSIAFVADGTSGLQIISVSSPAAPLLVRQVDTPGTARGVDVFENIAVVADDSPSNGLRVIDISNPAAAAIVGNLSLAGPVLDVAIDRGYAFVAAYTSGLHVVDVRLPTVPVLTISLPGAVATGMAPRDVAVAGQFALAASQRFSNAVATIVGIEEPAVSAQRGVLDFGQTYTGTGVAVAGALVYMTAASPSAASENGASGVTRLFIGQYIAQQDLALVPPVVTITQPNTTTTLVEGQTFTVRVTAVDDVAVGAVRFYVDGAVVFVDTSQPFEHSLTAPSGVSNVRLGADAIDLGGNVGTAAEVSIPIVPDPLTTVRGRVVDASGSPVAGATVSVLTFTTQTATDGSFTIFGVPTVRGDIVASAIYTPSVGDPLSGTSTPRAPVAGGETNVGNISIVAAVFETDYGVFWTNCDDCFQAYTLPFTFPFYGTPRTSAFVGSNGYITFNAGDSTYVETLAAFSSLPRISATFDDWYGARNSGTPQPGVWVNASLPGRFVVTHERVGHFSLGGQNTFQITLFADGRILFAYRTLSVTTSGMITGLTPGPNTPLQQVDFTASPDFVTPAATSVLEYFTGANPFDLANKGILFTPQPGGGYRVRVLPLP